MTLFRKTLIKLTILNAALLILLLSLLGSTVYFYEKKVLFQGSDRALRQAASDFDRHPFNGLGEPHVRDIRVPTVILDSKNKVITSMPAGIIDTKAMKPFLVKRSNVIVEKHVYWLRGEYYHMIRKPWNPDQKQTLYVYFIMNVDPERNLLNTLLSIILYGLAIGAVVSVVVGYFLARRALRPIETAWNRQNRFVADASHELRTPLSIIQLKIEGLLRQPRQRVQDVGEDIAVMLDETRRLSKLVANLLTLARSDANRLEVNLVPLDLSTMLKKVTEPFAEMAEFEEKSFTLAGTEEPIYINGDEQRIHQLLVILLDNAMKFTPKGGKISVACTRENKSAHLSVSDSGCGISEDDLKHIFDRFYQADNARSGQKGTGLGLSIAQWIVLKHRGKIDAESAPGKGTLFRVRLPLLKNEPADHHEFKEGEKMDDEKI
ncbi:sensor histidine kinase [Sporolactobacillus kofuensis]|uniref:histidine kinase n=1 Tax=Sporolactobacillus kofuensis TaxID=269672 RepID=A0ABW1WFZ7_9BACL|nr:HAMP domain-containing sensor histidine kinase [Sporolactobacillus kofuensis]MCO7176401.1 HAMP domain-containing histidine kinase [Sporolactobacillus kofuensis]